ncbi:MULTISPECIES: methyltransferase domain-containing protein [unclassified Polaromonas]|jgi:SAM-dependent methyltransferase|uniref:methyltransferase domain-containing protein n=1 Tax=unclassified Polaromonas TaxID=2638319 RepID=UPI000BC70444|nr:MULTISPECIES: methyltransferase domain-containing protein [unclassified Polaromonas]OYY31864.1 MAG: hypothetical protein B7Y60_23795 [Polaromonas sp. 35-63-35]OYZ75311.1 MAG: hypothetical protein B7Y09_24625 [Polaromonas sp. 24-63-21]OZA45267.1 MAG: hypothetical protein B7X88_24830 [Polaromonas sp. 17-63-33]
MFINIISCPLCEAGVENSSFKFSVSEEGHEIPILECVVCGLNYKSNHQANHGLSSIYNSNYSHFSNDKSLTGYKGRILRIPGSATKGLRHLDYGCGNGSFVEAALSNGLDSVGADPFLPDTTHIRFLKNRFYKIDAADEEILSLGKFDVITLWAVIEHLPRLRPTILNLSKMLKPGGKLIFNSPYGKSLISRFNGRHWKMATLPEHLHFQTIDSLRYISSLTGLTLKSVRNCGVPFPLGANSNNINDSVGGRRNIGSGDNAIPLNTISKILIFLRQIALGGGGNNLMAKFIRKLIHLAHIGDHLEAVFQRPRI